MCYFFSIASGGGVALLYASRELDKIQTANFDQKIGVQIIQNALKVFFVYTNNENVWKHCTYHGAN